VNEMQRALASGFGMTEAEAHAAVTPIRPEMGARVVQLAKVRPEGVSYLWRPYIPDGKLTLIDGDPGDGKSTLTTDIAARVSTGSPMPDGTPPTTGNVLMLSAEDGIADTIRPRVDAAAGDPERIFVFHEVIGEDERARPVELPGDLEHLRYLAVQHHVRLVTIDPLMAFLAGVDSHNDQSVRRALHPLAKLAEDTGTAVLVVRHLNKGSGKALYRGGGSIGIGAAARAVHLVAPDPDDESRRLLAPIKLNLAAKPPTLAYRLVSDELHGCVRIKWEGRSARTADELVSVEPAELREERITAVEFLSAALANGPRRSREVEEEAREAHGIAARTLDNARRRLGVQAHKIDKEWWIELPDEPRTQERNPQGVASLRPSTHSSDAADTDLGGDW